MFLKMFPPKETHHIYISISNLTKRMKSVIFMNEGMNREMTKMKEQMSSHTGKMNLGKKIILKKSLHYMIFLCHHLNAFSLKNAFVKTILEISSNNMIINY